MKLLLSKPWPPGFFLALMSGIGGVWILLVLLFFLTEAAAARALLALFTGSIFLAGFAWYGLTSWAWRQGQVTRESWRRPVTFFLFAWLLCLGSAWASGFNQGSSGSTAASTGRSTPAPPPTKLFPNGPRRFLSDLEAFDVQSGPYPVSFNGELGNGKDRIKLNGVLSPKGIGMHPPLAPKYAAASFRLGMGAAVFKAVVAINDSSNWCWSPATFTVLGDGKVLWKSKDLSHTTTRSQECSVDVSGVNVLELRVQVVNGSDGVHAVWVEPRLLQTADTPDPEARPALFAKGPREYLSDFTEFESRIGPWPVSRNGVIGPDNNPIEVGGVRSPKGLGMVPPDKPGLAYAKYRLGKKAAVFKAAVALNDNAKIVRDQAVFEVFGDDKRLWQSAPVGKGTKAQECSVDVSGVDVLELRVTSTGSHFGLHAVWLEPRLLQKADTPDTK
jgi:hypothetical protein